MSKLTIGVITGVVLTAAVAVPALASTSASNSEHKAATATTAPSAAPKAETKVAAASVTTKATTPAKAATIVLPVPAPTKQVPNPDPASAACKKNPAALYCSTGSVRYLLKMTPLAAHNLWLPTLNKWGVTNVSDSCITQQFKTQGSTMCVVRADHGSTNATLLFKTVYIDKYSPTTVQKQSDAIHAKAMAAADKATTAAAKAKILQAAAAAIDKLEATADAYNAKNPQSSVNVVVS